MENWGTTYLDQEETNFNQKYTPPNKGIPTFFKIIGEMRHVDAENLHEMNLEFMPGFNLSWFYTGADVKPQNRNDETKVFTR